MATPLARTGITGPDSCHTQTSPGVIHPFTVFDTTTGTPGDKVLVVRAGTGFIETSDTFPAGTTGGPITDRIQDGGINTRVLTTATRIERQAHSAVNEPTLITGVAAGTANINDLPFTAEQVDRGVWNAPGPVTIATFNAGDYLSAAAAGINTVMFDVNAIVRDDATGANSAIFKLRFAVDILATGNWDTATPALVEETIKAASFLEIFDLTIATTTINLTIESDSSLPASANDRVVSCYTRVTVVGPEGLRV